MTRFLLKTSRPRFWLYLAGPYLVGYTAGVDTLRVAFDPLFAAWFLYFLVPANLLLYGVNDLFDGDTDRFNPKKRERENLLERPHVSALRRALLLTGVVTALAVASAGTMALVLLWLAFLTLAIGYSAPPLRLKARPVVDSASNVLYGLPGILGFHQASGHLPAAEVVGAVLLWTAAMHLFSAVPDIESDRRAGLATTAVLLGYRTSLVACAGLWLGAIALVVASALPLAVAVVGALYPLVPLWLASSPTARIGPVYWLFPRINGAAGFALFAAAFMSKSYV
jgi:4-hydroxybenzoate polyprenyltransferase